LTKEGQPSNDSIESFMGNEGVEIRADKPRPIAWTGDCRAPLRDIDSAITQLRGRSTCCGRLHVELFREFPQFVSFGVCVGELFGPVTRTTSARAASWSLEFAVAMWRQRQAPPTSLPCDRCRRPHATPKHGSSPIVREPSRSPTRASHGALPKRLADSRRGRSKGCDQTNLLDAQ
jgi:hypothetical protein